MGQKREYLNRKQKLLTDKKVCEANRKLFQKFFEQQEYKLRRKNGIKDLDESSYKTLCGHIAYLRNVNLWFKNRDWKNNPYFKTIQGLQDNFAAVLSLL